MNTTRRCTACNNLCDLLEDGWVEGDLLSNCHSAPVMWTAPVLNWQQVASLNMLTVFQPLCAKFSRSNSNVPLRLNPWFTLMELYERGLPPEACANHCKVHGWNPILIVVPRAVETVESVECARCLQDEPDKRNTMIWAKK